MRNNQKRFQPAPAAAAPPPGAVYTVPTDFVDLPSRGMFYPAGHPLCGEKTIEIKYMTAKEEDILSSTVLMKNGLVIERFLQSIIVNEDIDPGTLLVGDRNAIMVASRITAYGPSYELGVYCDECGKYSEYKFNLNKSKTTEKCFDEEYLKMIACTYDPEKSLYNIELPISKVVVGLRLLTGDNSLTEENNNNLITSVLSQIIFSVNGDVNPGSIKEFVNNMPAGDSKYLNLN